MYINIYRYTNVLVMTIRNVKALSTGYGMIEVQLDKNIKRNISEEGLFRKNFK